MDDLVFHYPMSGGKLTSNQLQYVTDSVPDTRYSRDLDNQAPSNFEYDARGDLTRDAANDITNIVWTSRRKVKLVERSTNGMPHIDFRYDAEERRTTKVTKPHGSGQDSWVTDFSFRDRQGRILATYQEVTKPVAVEEYETSLILVGHTLFGHRRMGRTSPNLVINTSRFTAELKDGMFDNVAIIPPTDDSGPAANTYRSLRGAKVFELRDHAESVIGLVTDRRLGNDNSGSDDLVDEYTVPLRAASAFYPFGSEMPDDGTGSGEL